jgi:sporulation protein YlmC with PRC-barrel domain
MKSQKLTAGLIIVIASCLSCVATAQEDGRSAGTTRPQDASAMVDLTQGVYIATSDVDAHGLRWYDGQKLLNTQGAELGTIKDLIVHPQSSRVLYLAVSSGGIAGMGNSLRLVPVETVRRTNRGLEVDILKGEWLQIPPVTDKNYVIDRFDISATQHQTMVQQFGGASRSNRPAAAVATNTPGTPAQYNGLIRASMLRKKNIRAEENQTVGEIENVIVDLERGTAAALVDAMGEFTGLRAKYVIPLSRLVMDNPKQDPIATTLTRADFSRAQAGNFAMIGTRAGAEPPLSPTGRPTQNR